MKELNKIGPYKVIKRIAEGGMAEIYLAKTVARFGVSKLVAIKTTLTEHSDAAIFKNMFLKEIRISANLNHQNVVKIYDFGTHEDRAYMVMEFIHGVTLRDLIAFHRELEDPMATPFILYIIHQVALALGYAYQSPDPQTGGPLKLIHRDISPHNILVTYEGEVKVIDFGIAKGLVDSDLTQVGQVKGKVAYMSPEQISREALDNRTDIFSLGVVMWELLSNNRFFAGHTVSEVKESILQHKIEELPTSEIKDSAEDILRIIKKMLHQNRDARFGDATDVAREIGTLLSTRHPEFSVYSLSAYLKQIFARSYADSLTEISSVLQDDEITQTASNVRPVNLVTVSFPPPVPPAVQKIRAVPNRNEQNFAHILMIAGTVSVLLFSALIVGRTWINRESQLTVEPPVLQTQAFAPRPIVRHPPKPIPRVVASAKRTAPIAKKYPASKNRYHRK